MTAVVWPMEIGPVPALASAFQPRRELREQVEGARVNGGTVVLTQVLSGGGGVGKTQLAAACACDAVTEGYDLVVWAAATEAQQVITQYAQAAARVRLPGVEGRDPEADARLFLEWLATTSRRWLVVLDDVTDPAVLTSWWPASRTGSGWVLATTRLKDARMTGGGRTRIDIDVYTLEEASTFVQARLAGEGMGHLLDDRVPELAAALGHLPLALSHATAYMINEELTCAAYLALFMDQRTSLEQALPESADTEGYGRQITTTLLLSLGAAQSGDTTGFVTTALRLTALLGPAGHPFALWSAPSILGCLAPDGASPDQAHKALRLLHRYALITCETRAEPRAVRIHALTARAVRERTPGGQLPALTTAAADALMHVWPQLDEFHPDLAATLRANTDALTEHAFGPLWDPEGHPVLFRAGISLQGAGLVALAVEYWQKTTADCERMLGGEHPATLTARSHLASAYREAGRFMEAVALQERVVAHFERLLGGEHPSTLTVRNNLAATYGRAGRNKEAIGLQECVVAAREQLFGSGHASTVGARNNLASFYREAGRIEEAIALFERVVAQCEELFGDEHPRTLTVRNNLASSYRHGRQTEKSLGLLERLVAHCERLLGDEHPSTLTVRNNLASAYREAGRIVEAVALQERVLVDLKRLLGDDHPNTLGARNNLAIAYWQVGSMGEAITLLKGVVADCERLLGVDHPNTRKTRGTLAAYQDESRTRHEAP